jgi:large subunit ribosomal protein L2
MVFIIFMGFSYTSPGRRFVVFDSFRGITRKRPEKKRLRPTKRTCGRNHSGVITCRHRGGRHKRLYRQLDFHRKKLGWSGLVQSIEYDPGRNARLALIYYKDGEKNYIIAPQGLDVGQNVVAGFRVSIHIGNSIPLWNIPLGTNIYNVEVCPGSGGKIARSAGTSVQLVARSNGFSTLRLPSGEFRLVRQTCWATVGQVGNAAAMQGRVGKAGRIRWLGWRPSVRGAAINPNDHPHGGGEGRCAIGRVSPATPWGRVRLGVKTRRLNKYSDALILRTRSLLFLLEGI